MKFLVIEDDRVVNIAYWDPEFPTSQGWVEAPEGVEVGWLVQEDGSFLAPPVEPVVEAPRAPDIIGALEALAEKVGVSREELEEHLNGKR